MSAVLESVAAGAVSEAVAELARAATPSLALVRGSRGSAGSGVIWSAPRLVITNHHVVPGPSAELTLHGGRRVSARVMARAPRLDLAALVVDEDLPQAARARIGDSDALRVGDIVLALGNPMGERNAPSLGIVAAAASEVLRLAITLRPGNSGGALLNAGGEVVGIPHMVTGSGLALAVSTRTVERFLRGDAEPDVELRWI
jgi:serine protease Do